MFKAAFAATRFFDFATNRRTFKMRSGACAHSRKLHGLSSVLTDWTGTTDVDIQRRLKARQTCLDLVDLRDDLGTALSRDRPVLFAQAVLEAAGSVVAAVLARDINDQQLEEVVNNLALLSGAILLLTPKVLTLICDGDLSASPDCTMKAPIFLEVGTSFSHSTTNLDMLWFLFSTLNGYVGQGQAHQKELGRWKRLAYGADKLIQAGKMCYVVNRQDQALHDWQKANCRAKV